MGNVSELKTFILKIKLLKEMNLLGANMKIESKRNDQYENNHKF